MVYGCLGKHGKHLDTPKFSHHFPIMFPSFSHSSIALQAAFALQAGLISSYLMADGMAAAKDMFCC